MTLIGNNTSYARRALRGLRTLLFPRPPPRVSPRRAAVLAHRGTDGQAPENTIAGCRRAIEQGADGAEIDLCITRDRRLVLWHDADPDELVAVVRQGGGEGREFYPSVPDFGSELRRPVSQLSFDEFRRTHSYEPLSDLPASLLGFDPENDRRPVSFDDFAEWAVHEERMKVLVLDIKLKASDRQLVPVLLDALAKTLGRLPALRERRLYALTAQREIWEPLADIVTARSDLAPIAPVPDFELPGVMDTIERLHPAHVSIGINPRRTWASTRDDLVQAVRAREDGLLETVLAWTASDEKTLAELGRLAVDGVMTDDVPLARRILDREHRRHEHLLRRRERARIKMPGDKVR